MISQLVKKRTEILAITNFHTAQAGQLTANKLTISEQFHYCDLINDFVTVFSSQSEGLGKMVLGIVKYTYDHSSQLIGII